METARRCLFVCLTMTLVLMLAAVPDAGAAGKAQKVKFVLVGLSEGGVETASEPMAINMYYGALDYRMRTYSPLKGKYELEWVDTLFPTANDCLTGVASDAAQMTFSGPHYLEQIDPVWKVGEAPGVFESWDHFIRTMNTPAWQEFQEKMAKEKGVRVVKWMANNGDWFLYSDKGPIKTQADMSGQKIRYAGGEGFAKALKNMGATAISLPYTEVVTGLQTHMIDGLVTDMFAAQLFYELPRYTKYAVNFTWTIQPLCLVVSSAWWDKLPGEERQAIKDVFDRIDVSQYFGHVQQQLIEKWAAGPKTELLELSPEEKANWRKVIMDSGKEVLGSIAPELVQAIEESR
ncbi:MAG: TRAP transporter substrate-binding protein DctP [Thermodesulfobacteriota bacterium]